MVTAQAVRMRLDTALWDVLSNPAAATNVTPAQVHFALLPEEAARQNRRLSVELRETEIRISF
jgi:histidine phosphotransferase ChpT